MSLNECFERNLLRRINPNMKRARQSLEASRKRLNEARKLYEHGFYGPCIIVAYTAMLHAAKAILYRDGIIEKSHYCTFIYLREKYSDIIPRNVLVAFNVHRIERHEAIYGLDFKASKDDAKTIIVDAEVFIEAVEKVLKLSHNGV